MNLTANPLSRRNTATPGSCEELPFCRNTWQTNAEKLAKCRRVAIVGAPIIAHSAAALRNYRS